MHSWRVTTAVRIFAVVLAGGQAIDRGFLGPIGVVLLGVSIVAVACCAAELQTPGARSPWLSAAEGVMTGLLVGSAGAQAEPLLLCLAVPAVAAGVRSGRLATTNTSLITALTFGATGAALIPRNDIAAWLSSGLLWLAIGLGSGLLAAQQTRSLRKVEAAQAPYAAAHRLVAQLHSLVGDLPAMLDISHQAREIQDVAQAAVPADRSAVFVHGTSGALEPTAVIGQLSSGDHDLARLCTFQGRHLQLTGRAAFPLRVGQNVIGALVLHPRGPLQAAEANALQEQLDEHSIRLETARLVDEVRSVATTEERNRLARDIHDGVAQRIVSLGYLADDLAARSRDQVTREGAEALRTEITRLVGELRFSVFDLRHDIDVAGGLSGALSEYVRELSTQSDLRVHLTLDERGTPASRLTEAEVLRIAQEALGNVRRHAHAVNVWVRLTTDGCRVRLVVEDDGIGRVVPRPGHYGLHTMRERAELINADLDISPRADGGTVVTLQSRHQPSTQRGDHHDNERLARR